ncbi:hypothetical protein IFM12275_15400 [Nocardia sputorum]|nr:hypothetical protein IFM12275_15400 [Nocardia sputorum]
MLQAYATGREKNVRHVRMGIRRRPVLEAASGRSDSASAVVEVPLSETGKADDDQKLALDPDGRDRSLEA